MCAFVLLIICLVQGHGLFDYGVSAVVLFGEMPKVLQVVGGILIISGVYYYSGIEKGE